MSFWGDLAKKIAIHTAFNVKENVKRKALTSDKVLEKDSNKIKLIIKDNYSMFKQDFNVYDTNDKKLYTIVLKHFNQGAVIYDINKNALATVSKKISYRYIKFNLSIGKNDLGEVVFKNRYRATVNSNGWDIKADFFAYKHTVYNTKNEAVMLFYRVLDGNKYIIEVNDKADELMSLMLVSCLQVFKNIKLIRT